MGYIEETGAAQHYRDARITTIYEGTTGIQAGDLVGRKILRDGGAALKALIVDMSADGRRTRAPCGERLADDAWRPCATASQPLAAAAQWLAPIIPAIPGIAGAVSYNLLMLAGTVVGGWQLARARRGRRAAARPKSRRCGVLRGENPHGAVLRRADHACRGGVPQGDRGGCEAVLAMPEDQF